MIRSLLVTSIATLALGTVAHASTFDLSASIGKTPTFSVASGSLTATFTSPAGNGFQVQSTSGLLTFNTALLDNNFFGTDPLTISFSAPVTGSVAIPFAFLDSYSTTDSLSVTTNTGQMLSFLAIPDNLPLGEPEGIAILPLAAATSSLTLTGPVAFAIGNVTTTAAVTPEPASMVLVATGMAGAFLRRRQSR